ncbi:MAG: hypothetical protein IT373_18630 [Polyangiaceae bacterium]|nr:hypothetical protein [Polyangiaceae bacterium]
MASVGNGDAACEACAQENCCQELIDYTNDPANSALYSALVTCLQVNASLYCVDPNSCFYQICDATIDQGGQQVAIGFYLANTCADYMGANCCQELKTCLANATCNDCLLNGTVASCTASSLDEPVTDCQALCP